MGISKLLKKFDIKPIGIVKKDEQIILADNVATMISNKFNYIEYSYIYSRLVSTKIYIAIIPEGLPKAIYSYEENTLFISDLENPNSVSKELLYECIHAIQDIRDSKDNTRRLGQCIFADYKVYAMALNEVSIEYIVSKIFNEEKRYYEIYGIKAKTYSINRYPLICNILVQLLYTSNEETLVKSTIYSTDEFLIDGIEILGEGYYESLQKNLDDMLYMSEQIIGLNSSLKENSYKRNQEDYYRDLNSIKEKEMQIDKKYMETQMSIFTKLFDKRYNKIHTKEELEKYKTDLEEYKEVIGFYTDENQESFLKYYEDYYTKKENELILKEDEIKRKNEVALTIVSDNPIVQLFRRIKNTIIGKMFER